MNKSAYIKKVMYEYTIIVNDLKMLSITRYMLQWTTREAIRRKWEIRSSLGDRGNRQRGNRSNIQVDITRGIADVKGRRAISKIQADIARDIANVEGSEDRSNIHADISRNIADMKGSRERPNIQADTARETANMDGSGERFKIQDSS